MREMRIGKNDSGQRLDKFLSKALPSLPPSLLYKSVRTKKIKVNRKRAEAGQLLAEGDTLQLFLADDFFPAEQSSPKSPDLGKIRPGLDIVYEDDNILLLNKRPGVTVHEDEEGQDNTLILHVQAYLFQKGEYRPEEEQSFAPALCNRIDRNTGGLVIAAKNAEALREMNAIIKERQIRKYYLCAVHGIPVPRQAVLTGYLMKNPRDNMVSVFDAPRKEAKVIKTGYRLLASSGDLALLEVELFTGRTHQIRAHLSHIGHPLLGDGKYGINKSDKANGYKYQALWAYKLSFVPNGNVSLLSYLGGKTFRVPEDKIYFLSLFPTYRF
ncbi:MAG: RluA family pseudouridine synthase [Clostridia bacterium]|nr:RluA family pseudouridine synthase [Clostridia bacterium]